MVVYKNTDSETLENGRPEHERRDSRDILQRLARATSASPAPAQNEIPPRTSESIPDAAQAKASSDHGNESLTGLASDHFEDEQDATENRRRSSEPTPTVNIDEFSQLAEPASRLRTPKVTGGWVDTILEDTPRSSIINENLKTPMVTGAWIDTPLPAGGRGPPMPTPNIEDDRDFILEGNDKRKLATSDLVKKLSPKLDREPLRNSSRPLPRSALESVLNSAKAVLDPNNREKPGPFLANSDSEDDPALHLGESTIQSLEEILANDTDASFPPSPPVSDDQDKENQSPRSADLKPYTRQLSRLSSLLPSNRDARKNHAQLENAVASSGQIIRSSDKPQGECTEAGEFHDFIWPCERCGCPGRALTDSSTGGKMPRSLIAFNLKEDMTTLEIPFPRLWRWTQGDWRPHFTWIGLILFLGLSWWLAEGWMCRIYCHPRFAYSYTGYGIDVNAPEPPFVLEKMIWRWLSVGTIARPLYILLRALVRLAAEAIGWIAGFYAGNGGDTGTSTDRTMESKPASTDPGIPRPAWGPDLSMMDDEYL